MTFSALIFFALCALVIVVTYLAVRRGWGDLRVVAALCMIGCIFTMTLALINYTAAANLQVIITGIVLGGLGGGATLALAWYFHSNELKQGRKEMVEAE